MFRLNHLNIKSALFSILSIIFIGFIASGCSSDSGSGASLNGDLRYQVEGSEGETVYLSYGSYTQSGGDFSTIGEVTVSASGTAEGDLPDGNFTGYQLQASPIGNDTPSITLKLLSDGSVLGSTSEVNSEGIFMVEVGEIPHLGE